MCIHLAREHALEFEVGHLLASRLDILLHDDADFGVVLRARKFEQFTGVSQPAAEFFQRAEFIFQARAFAPSSCACFGLFQISGSSSCARTRRSRSCLVSKSK